LVDNGEVSANGAGKWGNYAVRETCRSFNIMIEHISDLRECFLIEGLIATE
jgi:hypothetical protein